MKLFPIGSVFLAPFWEPFKILAYSCIGPFQVDVLGANFKQPTCAGVSFWSVRVQTRFQLVVYSWSGNETNENDLNTISLNCHVMI